MEESRGGGWEGMRMVDGRSIVAGRIDDGVYVRIYTLAYLTTDDGDDDC